MLASDRPRRLTALVLAFVLCCAFALLPCHADAPQLKTTFTREELLADYDQLWRDLYENYPFFPVLERRGLAPESLRLLNRAILETRDLDVQGFVKLLRDTFYRMDALAHLMLLEPSGFDFYHQTLLPKQTWSDYEPRYDLVFDAQTEATYALLGGGGSGQSIFNDTATLTSRYYADERAAYFHFSSFDLPSANNGRDFVADALASMGDVEHIIFDITGNPGGLDSVWHENIVSPFGGEDISYTYIRRSPVTERFFYQEPRYRIQPICELPADVKVPDFVEELGFTDFVLATCPLPLEDFTGKRVNSSAHRWLLIDGGTASAADGLAAFCKRSGWATLVGSPTLGDGGDSLYPVMIRLENTGLLVLFSASAAANTDGSLNAETGTAPDIPIRKGESPLQACLRVIRRGR